MLRSFGSLCQLRDPGGYSHTLPKWVCAAHRGRDFRTGYLFQRRFLERGIIFRTHESSSFVSSHLKLFKDRLLLTSKLLYSCCTLCFSVQGGRILARAASADSAILDKQARGSLERVHNVPEGDGDGLKRKGRGRRRKIFSLRAWFCAW